MAFFLTQAPIRQQVFLNVLARFLWHIRPQTGFWRGHISTNGSSSGSGALRRAGWAVVAVDESGNLKAAAGRYRETFARAEPLEMAKTMQRPRTLDPLTLHICCEGRHRDSQWAKAKSLGSPRAHVWNRLLVSTTKSGRSRSRVVRQNATWRRSARPTCAKGETTLQMPSPRKGQKHTSLLFASPRQSLRVLPWPSKRHDGGPRRTLCSGSGVGTTPGLQRRDHGFWLLRAITKRKRHKEISAPASGQVCD